MCRNGYSTGMKGILDVNPHLLKLWPTGHDTLNNDEIDVYILFVHFMAVILH